MSTKSPVACNDSRLVENGPHKSSEKPPYEHLNGHHKYGGFYNILVTLNHRRPMRSIIIGTINGGYSHY